MQTRILTPPVCLPTGARYQYSKPSGERLVNTYMSINIAVDTYKFHGRRHDRHSYAQQQDARPRINLRLRLSSLFVQLYMSFRCIWCWSESVVIPRWIMEIYTGANVAATNHINDMTTRSVEVLHYEEDDGETPAHTKELIARTVS